MSVLGASFLNELLKKALCHLLAYYPYRKQLRFAPWKVTAAVIILQLMQAVLYGMVTADGAFVYEEEYLSALVYMAAYFFFIRADCFKLLFLYMFVTDHTMIIRGFSAFLETRLFYSKDMVFYLLRSTLLQTIALAVTLPFMMRFFAHAQNQVFSMDAPLFWRTAWMVPALTSTIVLMFTGKFTTEQARTWTFLDPFFASSVRVYRVFHIAEFSEHDPASDGSYRAGCHTGASAFHTESALWAA